MVSTGCIKFQPYSNLPFFLRQSLKNSPVFKNIFFYSWQGPDQPIHSFYACSNFREPQNEQAFISSKCRIIFIFEWPSTKFTRWIVYYNNNKNVCYSCGVKPVRVLCHFFFSWSLFFISTYIRYYKYLGGLNLDH